MCSMFSKNNNILLVNTCLVFFGSMYQNFEHFYRIWFYERENESPSRKTKEKSIL